MLKERKGNYRFSRDEKESGKKLEKAELDKESEEEMTSARRTGGNGLRKRS